MTETIVDIEVPDDPMQWQDDDPVGVAERLPVRREVVTDETLGTLIPLQEELLGLAQIAKTMAAANIVPKALRQHPEDVLAVILTGRELGVGPMTAIRNFHVIDGSVTIAPKFKVAEVHKRGLGRVFVHQAPRAVVVDGVEREKLCECGMRDGSNDETQAMWHATRHDQPGILYTSKLTWEQASHIMIDTWEGQQNARKKVESPIVEKSNWKMYPQRMLSWRAVGWLIDDAFSEVGTGLYSPDEMGAVTDEDGEPILDVKSTENIVRPSAPPVPSAQPDVIADVKQRIEKLPDDVKDALRDAWKARELPSPDRLLYSQQKVADALIVQAEQTAKKNQPTVETAPAAEPSDSTERPVEAPETPAEAVGVLPPAPVERTAESDAEWLDRAPGELLAQVGLELGELTPDEFDLRYKAAKLPRGGSKDQRQDRLFNWVVRRKMEAGG